MIKAAIRKVVSALRTKEMIPIIQTVPDSQMLAEKIVFITGGSGGIGKAIARKMLQAGAKVIISGTSEAKLQKTCADLSQDDRLRYAVLNIQKTDLIRTVVEKAVSQFPENRIDILVNCAGVVNKEDFFHITEDAYDQVMDINVKGTYFMCKTVARMMIDRKTKGHILNVSSSSAMRPAWTPYQMSKWAIRGFTLGLADTLLPYGIIVNAIGPGQTATQMLGKAEGDPIDNPAVPCGRYATPEEIANLALFMVSGTGDLIVGETYYLTGGSGTISMHR